MASNLFIAYDLNQPGQNYDAVHNAIKSLGKWHQFQFSLFYVNTQMTQQEAYTEVIKVMDPNDKLAVINASGGIVTTSDRPLLDEINAIWNLN